MLQVKSSSLISLLLMILHSSLSQGNGNMDKNIPMSMWMQMKDVRSTSEFIHTMVQAKPSSGLNSEERKIFKTTETGSTTFDNSEVERAANAIASPDVCEPRMMSVEIPTSNDPRIIYWPTCTQVQRCGGCCGVDLLECQPTHTTPYNVTVMQIRMSADDPNKYEYLKNTYVTLLRHDACSCECRTTASDCDRRIHSYDYASCKCRCLNAHLATSCIQPKVWDSSLCRCVCPRLMHCLDDEQFDYNTCRCRRDMVASGSDGLSLNDGPCSGFNIRCSVGSEVSYINGRCRCVRVRG